MLEILRGGAYARLRESIIRRLCDTGGVLLTPEQMSHGSERLLCEYGGDAVCLRAEVLTFGRLAYRVFAQYGGLGDPVLDEAGRLLTARLSLRDARRHLRLWSAASRRNSFLRSLLTTLDELKCYCLTPDILADASEQAAGQAKDRLWDLSVLLAAFERRTAGAAADPRDRASRLLDTLVRTGWAAGRRLYIDGFLSFTAQEGRILRHCIERAVSVTVALPDGQDHTLNQLRRWAGGEVKETRVTACRRSAPELKTLAERFPGGAAAARPAGAIRVFAAQDIQAECRFVVSECVRLAQEKRLRYRDMAVLAPSFERYAGTLELVCAEYGVPVFLDQVRGVTGSPLYRLTARALEAVCHGYGRDAVIACLKTGLGCLSLDETDVLENYALRWNLRGRRWTDDRDWRFPPGGYGAAEDPEGLNAVNGLRKRVRAMLLSLRDAPPQEAVGRFWAHLGLEEKLKARAERLRELGEPRLAAETEQLWAVYNHATEQCRLALGEERTTLAEFAELLETTLAQYEVGVIPVSLDRLQAGELGRTRVLEARQLFLMGCTADAVMRVPDAPGLLQDEDRVLLEQLGHDASPNKERRIDRELNDLRAALALPSEGLTVSRHLRSGEGETRASLVQTELARLFGLNEQNTWPTNRADMESAPTKASERPSPPGVLPASPIVNCQLSIVNCHLSATRLQTIQSCRFQYFARYVLGARERGAAGFSAPDQGSYVHAALERAVRRVMDSGGFQRVTREEALRAADEAMRDYRRDVLLAEEHSPRFTRLVDRLERAVRQMTRSLYDELRADAFQPLGMELRSEYGVIDRVDGYREPDGGLYLRVVDYKTGLTAFDFRDIRHGLGLQPLLYLFAVADGAARPAGALYWPARETLVQAPRGASREEILALANLSLRRSGLLLDKPGLPPPAGASKRVPTATAEQFDLLRGFVKRVAADAADSLRRGETAPNPYDNGTRTACDYCPYAAACGFDPAEDELRVLERITPEAFWAFVEQDEGGDAR